MTAVNNDLFRTEIIAHADGVIKATIYINAGSEILKGHFPGQAVVPGACMLQCTKEVLESALNCCIRLKKADQLKFMTMIDPQNTASVKLEINYLLVEGMISATARLSNTELVYFKFQGSFVVIQAFT